MKILKTIATIALTLAMAQGAAGQNVHNAYGNSDNVSDMVLIYAGNSSRNSWNMVQLTPYVTHTYADGSEKWFFDTFLFMEFVRSRTVDGKSVSFGFGNGLGGQKPATQEDWRWILDEYFAPGTSIYATKLAALDNLISDKIKTLGTPAFRHTVVIVCPAPKKDGSVWSTAAWGVVGRSQVSFATASGRLAAVQWYIDELLARWDAAGYKNIDLEGIYWVEESMLSNADIIQKVNEYAHSKGLRTYWIPFYHNDNEQYCRRWEGFGFDMCYFQPGYAFYRPDGSVYSKSQLTRTCQGAKKYGAGLELEFETSGTSNALHSADPAAHQRINDYMDVFDEEGVFDEAGVAYYVGSRGLNDMKLSTDPVDHATIDRMAAYVDARHKARFGDSHVAAPVEPDRTWAYAGEGRILTTTDARCYDAVGRLVHSGVGLFECLAGVYILKDAAGNTAKLLVK